MKQISNEEKKEYLNSYRDAQQEVKRIEYKIKELRMMKMFPSVVIDDMPHGSGKSDLSDYAEKLDELINTYTKERYKRIMLFKEITDQIEQLGNDRERQVLFERYIKGEKWERICVNIGLNWTHTHRIHKKALENFKMV